MLAKHMIDDAVVQLGKLKEQADKAIAQVTGEQLFATLDDEANSIALIMKHLAGNMRSRWTNFLTSDGEKPDRNRDSEFEAEGGDTRETILAAWEREKTVRIRGQAHTVVEAINRQLSHYAAHVGQIVLLAKHYAGARWQTLSVPKRKVAQS
jgi:hypothetical protein